MTDQFGLVYGGALILGGLLGYLKGRSAISLLFGIVFGAWSIYNASHPTRQNNVANLAIGAVLGIVMLLRFLIGGKWFPTLLILGLSGVQVFRNYPYLK
ncbi:unnamed protein product [Adineta steineri]|uniref:Uncharacterized protein n=1 Tax=Adineta steineri TaxID=433720 RepID=A0A814R4C3_9BILA|nr:unnamed protein product [Adineta steineri]CAF1128405.1 unnamed protein product [Adineta steineri]CAF1149743.1 unnamed protein product [Adineta steineri]CAF3832316.1 unnamed protein product [Adineta steineri]CAF3996836.1 unnamed protein product [Adineta steineri]